MTKNAVASTAAMPTNIALIKYMGKKDVENNIPSNSSFSYTLDNLRTTVILTPIDGVEDQWDSTENKTRFIKHLNYLRQKFNKKLYFKIKSENNFPSDCGLASSASSFAALTEAALKAFGINNIDIQERASLSRHGSGSSCRSFMDGFVVWHDEKIEKIELPYKKLIHHVIVISKDKKIVSSSEAHKLVKSSLLFSDRKIRAEKRLEELLSNFKQQDWQRCYELIWQEFQDMNALFETCQKPFSYLKLSSYFVLQALRDYWEAHHDGPLVTMDAGPNVHLLFREDQQKMVDILMSAFREKFLVL